MKTYIMELIDANYCILFKYNGDASQLLKIFESGINFFRVDDLILNKNRVKEIKGISLEEFTKHGSPIGEIEFVANKASRNIDIDIEIKKHLEKYGAEYQMNEIAKELRENLLNKSFRFTWK